MVIEYIEFEQVFVLIVKFGLYVCDEGLFFFVFVCFVVGMFGVDVYLIFEEKVVVLISLVVQNYVLFDGNKCIFLYLMFVFIWFNGYDVIFMNDEVFDFVFDVVQSWLDLKEIVCVFVVYI